MKFSPRVGIGAALTSLLALLAGLLAVTTAGSASAATSTVSAAADTTAGPTPAPRTSARPRPGRRMGGRRVRRHGFLKFQAPPHRPGRGTLGVLSAYSQGSASDGAGPAVHVTSDRWREERLTWKNQPAPGELLDPGRRLRRRHVGRLGRHRGGPAGRRHGQLPHRDHRAEVARVRVQRERQRPRAAARCSPRNRCPARPRTPRRPRTRPRPRTPRRPRTRPRHRTRPRPDPTPTQDPAAGSAAQAHGWGRPSRVTSSTTPGSGRDEVERLQLGRACGKGVRSPAAWNVNGSAVRVTGDSQGTTGGMSASSTTGSTDAGRPGCGPTPATRSTTRS